MIFNLRITDHNEIFKTEHWRQTLDGVMIKASTYFFPLCEGSDTDKGLGFRQEEKPLYWVKKEEVIFYN